MGVREGKGNQSRVAGFGKATAGMMPALNANLEAGPSDDPETIRVSVRMGLFEPGFFLADDDDRVQDFSKIDYVTARLLLRSLCASKSILVAEIGGQELDLIYAECYFNSVMYINAQVGYNHALRQRIIEDGNATFLESLGHLYVLFFYFC